MIFRNCSVIILAAGKGERMLSDIPKVMHSIAGKSMLQHVIDSVVQVGITSVYVVCGYKKDMIVEMISKNKQKVFINWIYQRDMYGTGHAIKQALTNIRGGDDEEILILYGDVPLISSSTLRLLRNSWLKLKCDINLLTAVLDNPCGYGRIVRNKLGDVINIIEDSDIISDAEKSIKEVNTGIFVTFLKYLKCWLNKLTNDNLKHEFYLTDIINIAYKIGHSINTICPLNTFEVIGVNTKSDLIYLERKYQNIQAQNLLSLGVTISDPNRFDLRGTLIHGRDVYIDINVIIEGNVILGDRVHIGSGCILKDVTIGNDVVIRAFSILENTKVECNSCVGPFSRIRPGTELKKNSCVGNFVEIKNTVFGKGSKVNHLSYLGDTTVGNQVNIGAGTITCNYDGVKKNHTTIGDNVFVGANSQLIAPVNIGNNVVIGAGTTVTRDVSEGEVVISRIRQFSILNAKRLKKKV